MNYIYDILLNFKDDYYDFYDWNKNDSIIHIRKIPIFRVSTNDLLNIKNNKIKLDISFVEKLDNKTEMFTNKGVKKIKNACLLSDGDSTIGINIVQKKIKISSLLIDEELDSLEDVYMMDVENIEYTIKNYCNKCELKTRKQLEVDAFLKKELSKIGKDNEKLKYLYYECFDKKEDNIKKIKLELESLTDENIINKLYNFFKLLEVNK